MPYLASAGGYSDGERFSLEDVLRDVRTTISELVVDVFYKTLAACTIITAASSRPNVAPTMVSDGLLHYQVADRPMGILVEQSTR